MNAQLVSSGSGSNRRGGSGWGGGGSDYDEGILVRLSSANKAKRGKEMMFDSCAFNRDECFDSKNRVKKRPE